jgi:competence protein ComEC
MDRYSWTVVCLAYVIGLLSALGADFLELNAITLVVIASCFSAIAVYWVGYFNHRRFNKIIYVIALAISILAGFYWQMRIPQPLADDISHQVLKEKNPIVIVEGIIITEPKLTASHKIQFEFKTEQITQDKNQSQPVSGKMYATLPLLQGTGLYLGEKLKLKGVLYQPPENNRPGEFNFRAYLARRGIFAGIKGKEAILLGDRDWKERTSRDQQKWGWWKLRHRIVKAHLQTLGSPVGQLVSSMVIGSKAVDLPTDIKDSFIKTGLAHALAASGFQVSLLLGIVLKLTNRLAARSQLAVGLGVLLVYLGLTGLQPSIVRATLMGISLLIAHATESKVRSLGSLLLVATIILLFNPLWIGDVGFQLSFLATFGLIVTLPSLQAKLEWLPSAIAILVAIPVAASIWVLPLLSYIFHTIAVYSLPANILTTPFITIITLVGTISSILALIMPGLGGAIALLLFYPTTILIKFVEFVANLPGSTMTVGNISLVWLVIIYGFLCSVWLSKWWQNRWWLALVLIVAMTVMTLGSHSKEFQVADSRNSNSVDLETRSTSFRQDW